MRRQPLAGEAGQALAFLERTDGAGGEDLVHVVDEEVGGGGQLFARALAVEGPGKSGVAAGPVLRGEVGSPLGDEGGFAFTAVGDEGEDADVLRGPYWTLGSSRTRRRGEASFPPRNQ